MQFVESKTQCDRVLVQINNFPMAFVEYKMRTHIAVLIKCLDAEYTTYIEIYEVDKITTVK